jgi:amino acid adenylation domain-containing protein
MDDPLEDVLAQLSAFQPERLTSYASSLSFLAGLTLEGKLPILPHEVVISSDRLTAAMQERIKQAWNPGIYDIYAAIESLYMAVRQPGNEDWTVVDELNLLECMDEENHPVAPGMHGRAVLTNLYNYTNPFIRYDLKDYIVPGQPRHGHPTLQAILGKTHDALPVLRDDGQVGAIPSYDLARFHLPGIDLIQFVTHRPDYFVIEYCGKATIDEAIEHAFREVLIDHGATRTRFQVKRVEHIWNTKGASKLKLIRRPEDEPIVIQPAGSPIQLKEPANWDIRPQNAYVPFPGELVESSIAHCFERQVERYPGRTAIQDGPERWTYAQLNQAANRVADRLQAVGAGSERPVALLFGHRAAMVVAMYGVLKAGRFYVPLDPAFPEKRNTAILEDAQANILLTASEGVAKAEAFAGNAATIINLDEIAPHAHNENPRLPLRPDAPACLLYTSGSTGTPKGVLLDQRTILHRVMLYTNDYHICAEDRLSLLQPYVTSASTRDLFGALLNGAGLYLYDVKRNGVQSLAQWLIDERITVFYSVPSVFRAFLETLDHQQFISLRLIRLGGEPVLPRDVEGYQRHFEKGCLLVNALASTETGTTCQYFMNHETRIVGNLVPVGYPTQDKESALLDDNGNQVQDGKVGEIVVRSACMGPGYWREAGIRPASPDEIQKPADRVFHTGDLGFRLSDGRITLAGRKDWTVKVHGQRINLLEIEQMLVGLENIRQAVVINFLAPEGSSHLVAYLQPGSRPAPSLESIRQSLAVFLPSYMIPSTIIFVDSFPLTPGGKIDRQFLPAKGIQPELVAIEINPASTPAEEMLVGIWRDVLKLDQFGVDDGFFDLGGDSLQVALMLGKIEKRFGQKLPANVLVQHDTIRKLAGLLARGEPPKPANELVVLQPKGEASPLFLVPGLGTSLLSLHDLVQDLGMDRPVIGLQDNLQEKARLVDATVEVRAEAYLKVIRSRYPHGPYYLAGHSFGGLIALEIGRRLIEQGEQVPLLGLLDTLPPGMKRKNSLPTRLIIHWDNLRAAESLRDVAAYISKRIQRLVLRMIKLQPIRRLVEISKISVRDKNASASVAVAWYAPMPYPGDVVLFMVSERPWYMTWDPMVGWKDFIQGHLEIRKVPGNHMTLLKEPHVRELARQLKDRMD